MNNITIISPSFTNNQNISSMPARIISLTDKQILNSVFINTGNISGDILLFMYNRADNDTVPLPILTLRPNSYHYISRDSLAFYTQNLDLYVKTVNDQVIFPPKTIQIVPEIKQVNI